MAALTTRELASLVGGELRGDAQVRIEDVAELTEAGANRVVFVENTAALTKISAAPVGAVLLSESLAVPAAKKSQAAALIIVAEPLWAFVAAMLHLRPAAAAPEVGVSPAATVSPSAQFGDNCQVFPSATIGEEVRCGRDCIIYPGAYIGDRCVLGDGVVVHPNAVLYSEVRVGDRCIIHASAIIGADGFGYRFRNGRFQKIPHTGTVIIESDVEIGAGTTIDRGMIGATVIGEGTKLDNQVMIAHNCRVGRHNVVASQAGFAGSSTSGDYVRCGGQAGISDHSHLGTGCSVGGKAGLFGTVPDGAEYHGCPAGPAKEQYRIVMTMQKLPEMRKQLKQLEAEVRALRHLLNPAGPHTEESGLTQQPAAA
jgi:UDP-3-O-[3-hydroxymyristoyl] glucosamine N-acyltransferase